MANVQAHAAAEASMAVAPTCPKRVIFVTDSFHAVSTGPGTYANLLWEAFANDSAIDFHIVTPEPAPQHPKVHAVSRGRLPGDAYQNLQDEARRLIVDPANTLIHANAPHLAADLMDSGATVVVQVNDYEGAVLRRQWPAILRQDGPRRVMSLLWRRRKERMVFQRAHRLLCNSRATRTLNCDEYGIDKSKALLLYKSANIDAFTPPAILPPDPLPDRPGANRFLFVGSHWERKGLPLLLDALKSMRGVGMAFSLTIVGAISGAANKRMLRSAQSAFAPGELIFTGPKTAAEIATLMWHSEYFVLPSRREALGVAIIEAMAASMIVIATREGGIPEIVNHGENGLLLDRSEPGALADLIDDVRRNSALQQRLRKGAAARAFDFSKTGMIQKVRDFYLTGSIGEI